MARQKKMSTKMTLTLIIPLIFLAIAAVCGFFVAEKVTKEDVFALNGDKFVEVVIGEEYVEEGCKVISFGKDLSNKLVIDDQVNYDVVGTYYIRYTVDNFRFKGVERFRIIKVVEAPDESV